MPLTVYRLYFFCLVYVFSYRYSVWQICDVVIICPFYLCTSWMGRAVWQDADRDSGPSGATGCIQISRYGNQYQWATCLTDTYIQQKSGHKYQCNDRSRIFYWYQRMLEVHNKDNGPVIKDCSCNPSLFTASPTTSLPADCYSPSGDSCDWYRNCLEKKYACEATSNLRN